MKDNDFTVEQYNRVLHHVVRYTRRGEFPLSQTIANIALATGCSKASKILIKLRDEGKIKIVRSSRRQPNKIYFIDDKS